ncbi:MAG: hypothetical protein K2Q11_04740 [Burkholderiaceae bacterium]|nr:hypothetical protein [Burkholderiaceae bacterium]
MATQFPFSFLSDVLARMAPVPQPPQWLVDEVQHRTVLLLNHVLGQEPAATERLLRQRGRVVRVQWRHFFMALQVTPAGLFDLACESITPDLRLEVTQDSPLDLAQMVLRGERPAVRIDGDVQFAGDIQWLADNLRWDIEEDLARLMGDVPAHALTQAAQRAAQALRQFVGSRVNPTDSPAPSAAPVWSDERTIP